MGRAVADLRVERFESADGVQIFRLPLEVFAGYIGYAHLLVGAGPLTLVDVGSGFGGSTADLLAGLEVVEREFSVRARLAEVERIIITHGHIDHFGGLTDVLAVAQDARIAAHPLTRPVLSNYTERLLTTRTAVEDFLLRAGVPAERRTTLLEMHMLGKRTFSSVRMDDALKDGMTVEGGLQVIHVPGHAPGLIMLRVGDILLTADHILPETSVALGPESITPYTGVGHYIESLEKAAQLSGVRVALGGHEAPMHDFDAVAARTLANARAKVELVLAHCDEPRTIYEIAQRIYGALDGYGELLKVEQTGARVEYLSLRGSVALANLDALETAHSPALQFRRTDDGGDGAW